MKFSIHSVAPKKLIAIAILASAIVLVAITIAFTLTRPTDTVPTNSESDPTATPASLVEPDETPANTAAAAEDPQHSLLLYLIEEEKLAHDVYTDMFQTYGSRVFENILSSEQSHQNQVLTLLQARNIADPRSSELGVFANSELQQLYNSLITQGKQNLTEAFKVGVAIEEKDIADITNQLATATDSDIISTLESLRNGSENHLRAFNRQLGR